jgi:YqaJ-like viral recombinase domain
MRLEAQTTGGSGVIQHEIEQGHVDWFNLRIGKVTASEMKNLLTPEFELRKGEMPKTYLYSKLAELWRGKPLISTGSWATEQGQLREEEAIPWLALENGWKIRPGGFIESDDGRCGCSPDGLVSDNLGIEVKCPEPTNHVRYLIEGKVPKEYVVQVYASLYVTGFPKWLFFSYQRGFPPLIIEVPREEAIMQKIGEAVASFHSELAKAKERIAKYDK